MYVLDLLYVGRLFVSSLLSVPLDLVFVLHVKDCSLLSLSLSLSLSACRHWGEGRERGQIACEAFFLSSQLFFYYTLKSYIVSSGLIDASFGILWTTFYFGVLFGV